MKQAAPHKTPSRKVTTVTSDEENLRLNIYDGVIPLSEADAVLVADLRTALSKAHAETRYLRTRLDYYMNRPVRHVIRDHLYRRDLTRRLLT